VDIVCIVTIPYFGFSVGVLFVLRKHGGVFCRSWSVSICRDGFGGLVVSMLASGSRVRGFDPDRSR
jgi:hypothetical protein